MVGVYCLLSIINIFIYLFIFSKGHKVGEMREWKRERAVSFLLQLSHVNQIEKHPLSLSLSLPLLPASRNRQRQDSKDG
jgi:hypothetical protein